MTISEQCSAVMQKFFTGAASCWLPAVSQAVPCLLASRTKSEKDLGMFSTVQERGELLPARKHEVLLLLLPTYLISVTC